MSQGRRQAPSNVHPPRGADTTTVGAQVSSIICTIAFLIDDPRAGGLHRGQKASPGLEALESHARVVRVVVSAPLPVSAADFVGERLLQSLPCATHQAAATRPDHRGSHVATRESLLHQDRSSSGDTDLQGAEQIPGAAYAGYRPGQHPCSRTSLLLDQVTVEITWPVPGATLLSGSGRPCHRANPGSPDIQWPPEDWTCSIAGAEGTSRPLGHSIGEVRPTPCRTGNRST